MEVHISRIRLRMPPRQRELEPGRSLDGRCLRRAVLFPVSTAHFPGGRAAVLEPTPMVEASTEDDELSEEPQAKDEHVTSHGTSQSLTADDQKREIAKEIGSSGWTRTSNPPVNSRMLCH